MNAGSPPAVITWAGGEDGAVVEVTATGAAAAAVQRVLPGLLDARVASRLGAQDPGLWGEDHAAQAEDRLGWTDLHATSRSLVGELADLRAELAREGVDRVVLAGMGGSSLAAEVITGTVAAPLTVVDSTVPSQVERVLDGDLERTVLVVASRSGTTVETDAHLRVFTAAFAAAGIDPARRIVVVTKPGSPLAERAAADGFRAVFTADPRTGGRFSALSAYGLVPSALAGADVERLLDEAADVAQFFTEDTEANPALVLAAAIAGTEPLHNVVPLVDAGSGLHRFTAWVEQLLAESLGKGGRGLLPVVVGPRSPEVTTPGPRSLPVLLTPLTDDDGDESPVPEGEAATVAPTEVSVAGSLGGMFLLWQHAVAVAGRILDIYPFDQPDIEATKEATRGFLSGMPSLEPPAYTDSGVEVRAPRRLLRGTSSVAEALEVLLGRLDPEVGYLAVLAYLDREGRPAELLRGLRDRLAERTGRPVTFGWGPQYLHSTGQLHKGGPPHGVFLMLTGGPSPHVAIPGRDFDFAELVRAQADADAGVLRELGRPVLRLHVDTPDALAWLVGSLTARSHP